MGGGIKQKVGGGTLTVTARVSNGSSRYAMPTIPKLVYAALLYTGESPENPLSEDFVEGRAGEENKFVFSFQRPDEKDGLTLEVFAFKAGTTTFSKGNALLSGKKTNLEVKNDKIEVVETIALSVYEKSEEKGTVSLKIKVPVDCTIEIKELKTDGTPESDPHFTHTGDSPDFTITQNGAGIPAGAYQVTFTVKKVNGEKEEIIHIFTESINVLPGMHTDTWWNGATSSATKVITQDMASTTVYVRGTGGYYETSTYNATATASDDNSGSFLAPLATIQKAVDTIIARNDGTSDYTIYIDGTLDGTTAESLGSYGMADFSALAQDLNLTIKALSGTATLDGGARFDADGNVETGKEEIKKRIIYASNLSIVLNLTLENLIVTGGYYDSGYGGGIVFSSPGGELKISKGTTICGNKALHAGGVFVSKGTCYMNDGKINDCTAEDHGGGVYINLGGKFIMKGGAISNNKAKYGGGIMVQVGTFEMSGGTIGGENAEDGNTANYGGGVYVNQGTFTMEGGTISGNEAAVKGSGVYQYGMFNMSDTAKFESGNDVYLSENKTICVAGELSDSIPVPVAIITPSDYAENRPLLTAGENVTLDGSICDKFAVTPKSDGTEWRVALDGANGVLIRKYEMGDTGQGGGVVFYYSADGFTVNGKTCYYLEASKESLGNIKWCACSACDLEQSTSARIGAGYANTQAILDHSNHASATASNCAAKACADYKTDTTAAGEWFLPSRLEAKTIRESITGVEDLWTSCASTLSGSMSYATYFQVLSNGGNFVSVLKSSTYSVRAVRGF